MRRLVLAAFTLTFVAACQPATDEMTVEQEAEIVAEVKLINGQFWDSWRVYDGRGMSYYYNSPEFVFGMEGQVLHGWSAVNDMVASSNVTAQRITFNESQATVLAPNVVCVMEQGTYTETFDTGETGPETVFAFTAIWVRQDGEWKVHLGHASMPTPESP